MFVIVMAAMRPILGIASEARAKSSESYLSPAPSSGQSIVRNAITRGPDLNSLRRSGTRSRCICALSRKCLRKT